MAVVEKGPTQVQEVLAKGPVPNPYPTLDVARNDPATRRPRPDRDVLKLTSEGPATSSRPGPSRPSS